MSLTFKEDEKSALREARLARLEADERRARVDRDALLAESPAVLEGALAACLDLDVVVAQALALDIQLEVKDGDADSLARLHRQVPHTLSVGVVLGRVVGRSDVAVVEEGCRAS